MLKLTLACALLFWCTVASLRSEENSSESFDTYVAGIWSEAQEGGISRYTFDQAIAGLQPDEAVLKAMRSQPEFSKPVGEYLAGSVSAGRVARGRQQAHKHEELLSRIEQHFGVDPLVVVAIWGVETDFGALGSSRDVFRSLATLAFARYRGDFFRTEFLAALRILQDDHVGRAQMRGSWAGAMGQPQFMPTSFLKFAVSFSGDGRRDIWTSIPDTLGSIANYLEQSGWIPGLPWGIEVTLPQGFDYMRSRGTFREWAALGVRSATGSALPQEGTAVLLFPSGGEGPAFLVTQNYLAIKSYNNSDAYVLAVGHLAERMRGGGMIVGRWPKMPPLPRKERIALQRHMARLGYTVNNFVGQIDFDLRDAIRDVQRKAGWQPDGHPSRKLLDLLASTRG